MGKTSKPLRIGVQQNIKEWSELAALKAQGHEINALYDYDYDLILGPTCHRMNEDLRKYLPLALAEARRVKYPKSEKA